MNDQYNKFRQTSTALDVKAKAPGELNNFFLKAYVNKHTI
jgi:hypothetical protein